MNDIVKLVPKRLATNDGVISALENMLMCARADGLLGIAIVGVDAEGCSHTCFEPGENIATLLGGVIRVQQRLVNHWIPDE